MKALSPADQLFLWLEKRQQPMHVGGLLLFSFPEGATPKYVTETANFLYQFKEPAQRYHQKLVRRAGRYYWDYDDHFDLSHHFRHLALPKPGRIRELLSLVSIEHSNLLDRERPLWEFYLIEGVRGRRFAVYCKVHHAMMDGIAAMRRCQEFLSYNPDETNTPPFWMIDPPKRERTADSRDIITGFSSVMLDLQKQVSTIPRVSREITKQIRYGRSDKNRVSVFQAPHSIINQPITGSRRFAAQSYSIDRVKRLSRAFGCTVNDIVLAMCASALREYLINQQALPNAPLIAMVPVSIRRDSGNSGNQIAMILVNLGTHIADPAGRLRTIVDSVQVSKQRYKSMSPEECLNYTALSLAPAGLNMLTGLVPNWQPFNVIISNVPGPKRTMYWNGAKLEGMYPVSLPLDRIALNITLLSYNDQLEFGITACRRTLPSMQRLLDFLEDSIHELEVAADIHYEAID